MPTPIRTFRADDQLWDAVKATAEAEKVDTSTVVRNALYAYVKAGAALVVAFTALLVLGACGGGGAPAAPVSEPSATVAVQASVPASASETLSDADAQAIIDASIWAELAADPEVNTVLLRVTKGECFSVSFGSSAERWAEHMDDRPQPVDGSAWLETMQRWVESLPIGCDEVDRTALGFYLY